ncbi:MAG: hypothetical protein AB7O13_07840 [Alphaproteobacteria bacterium]
MLAEKALELCKKYFGFAGRMIARLQFRNDLTLPLGVGLALEHMTTDHFKIGLVIGRFAYSLSVQDTKAKFSLSGTKQRPSANTERGSRR